MTMRQVFKLLALINRADLVEFYNLILSYRTMNGPKLPSLDEFLALTSDKDANGASNFDETTDKFLEEQAKKRLLERQKAHGQ